MTTSNANPTVSTTTPVLSDAVQRCVDTATEAIATNREARINFLQSLVKKMLRETYKEAPTPNPPSVGIPTTQSGINVAPSRGVYPSFVIHPNYHNGQIHYPPYPISQPPTTSAGTTAAKNDIHPKCIHCKNLICNNHCCHLQQPQQHYIQTQFYHQQHTDLILCLPLCLWWNPSPRQIFFLWLI